MRFKRTLIILAMMMLLPALSNYAQDLPTLYAPEDQATCVSKSVVFDWSDVANLSYYTIQISLFSDFSILVDETPGLTNSSHVSNVLQYGNSYYWRIQTNYTDNTSLTTDAFRFTTKIAPPALNTPLNGVDCMNQAVRFEWYEVDNTVNYHLQVATASTFGQDDLVINKDDLEQLYWNDVIFEEGTTYFWRVKAYAGCETDWSVVRQFTVKDPPPLAIYPEPNQECVEKIVTFVWEENTDADNYLFQISEFANFNDDPEPIELTETSYTSNMPEYYKTYYWRVKTFIGDCETNWSVAYQFKTAQEIPILEIPANDAKGVPLDQKLSWDIDGEPNSYILEVSLNEEFTAVIPGPASIATKYYDLDLETQYYNTDLYWRVKAVYDDCNTEWSEIEHFRTQYPPVILTEPTESKVCVPLSAKLVWEPIDGATKYTVHVSTESDFSTGVTPYNDISDAFKYIELSLGQTTYFWRVRADDDYNEGKWSETWWFQTTFSTPVLTYPPNEASGQEKQVTFTWEKIGDNIQYQLLVSEDPTFDETQTIIIVDEEGITQTSYTAEMPDYYKIYYWKVQAKGFGQSCESAWSEVYSFKTIIPSPTLVYPENNSTNLPLSILFQWEKITDAQTYEINLASDEHFDHIVFGQVGVSTNSIIAQNLYDHTDYYWRVNASNADGTSEWSEIFKFTTGGIGPDKVILEYPLKGAKKVEIDLAVRWKAANLAETYILQIAENSNFYNPVVDESGILDITYDLSTSGLENYTEYYWRVQAVNADGVSQWSDIWNFRIIALPPQTAPVLLKPQMQGINEPKALLFEWSDVDDASSYHLQIALENTFDQGVLIIDQNRIYSTEKFVNALQWETNYFWRARAENEAGPGPWSAIWSFETMLSVEENVSKYQVSVVPNPVTQTASVQFVLPEMNETAIEIYNMNGQIVDIINTGYLAAGSHYFTWNPKNLESGSYLIQITVGKDKAVKQVILMK